jgi:hypothetical protein
LSDVKQSFSYNIWTSRPSAPCTICFTLRHQHRITQFQQALDNTDVLSSPPLSAQETAQIISI